MTNVGGGNEPGAWGPPPPYPPPSYPGGPSQPPYPPYGYVPQKSNGKATAALVCSILNFVLCPVVLAIVGLVLANQASREIRASGGTQSGEGIANAARIISIIGIALGGVGLVAVVAILAISFLGTTSSSTFSSVGTSIGGSGQILLPVLSRLAGLAI